MKHRKRRHTFEKLGWRVPYILLACVASRRTLAVIWSFCFSFRYLLQAEPLLRWQSFSFKRIITLFDQSLAFTTVLNFFEVAS